MSKRLVALAFIAVLSPSVSPCYQQAPASALPGVSLLEAVQSTLATNPQLKIQQLQVDFSRGAQQQAAGAFDFDMQSSLLQQRVNNPLTTYQQVSSGTTISNQVEELTTYSFEASKLFRNGLLFSPSLTLERTVDNLVATTGTNVANASLQLTIPLLQGRGSKAVDAQERAAAQEVTATTFDEAQLVAQLMTTTVNDYWNLVASYKILTIDIDSEKRGAQYRDNVQTLIDADAVPRSDINAAAANLAQRSATRSLAEQQLVAARQQLALDMGTNAAGMLSGFQPSDDFPGSDTGRRVREDAASLRSYLDGALINRGDYRAATMRVAEDETLLAGAKNRILPQLNITIAAGYTGLEEGRQLTALFAPAYSGTRGPNATAGINYSFPPQNDVARGLLLQSQATLGQASAHAGDIARTIGASIVTAVSAVGSSLSQSAEARRSVQGYAAALAGQQDKYRLGTGSIVEILTVEDLLTNALLSQVQAELAYAQSITQFRFATGMLLAADQTRQSISPDIFRTLPPAVLVPGNR